MKPRDTAGTSTKQAQLRTGDRPGSEDRLDSWKEIAAFLKRGIRTIQRWEKMEGLPVHRLPHDKLGSIFAYRSEVSAWWNSRATRPGSSGESERPAAPPADVLRATDVPAVAAKLVVLPFRSMSQQPED
jgi:hypothetical protein